MAFLPLASCGLILVFLGGCSLDSNIDLINPPANLSDFKRSEIITNSPGVADGSSELIVVIQLMNSNGSLVRLHKPTYEVIQGAGVIGSECTTSNNNGLSTCILKSTQAGTKRISVTNVKIDLQKNVVFDAPSSKAMFGLAVASGTRTSSNSFSLHGAVGGNQPKALNTTPSGFKLWGGPEGNVFSR